MQARITLTGDANDLLRWLKKDDLVEMLNFDICLQQAVSYSGVTTTMSPRNQEGKQTTRIKLEMQK